MSHAAAGHEAGDGDSHAPKGASGNSITGMVLAVALVLILAFFANKCTSSEGGNGQGKTQAVAPSVMMVPEIERTPVQFEKEYGKIQFVPSGIASIQFEKATQPYCAINKAGKEECGKAGQDVSDPFGVSEANTEFRFRSTNGESGSLEIRTQRRIIQ
jgi:hypothetical protein